MSKEQIERIEECVDMLAIALTDHDHIRTSEQRELYERTIATLELYK